MFTVPAGGGGLYYLSTFLLVSFAEDAQFSIKVNDVVVASSYGHGIDRVQATCSAVVDVTEGKINKNAFHWDAYRPLQWPPGGGCLPGGV